MPRIIQPNVGKVAGPLRMKVAQTPPFASSKALTPNDKVHDRTPIILSNQDVRRGRYSRRNVNGLSKSRSKSLPTSKQASLLLGKPPDDDESLQEALIHNSDKYKNSNKFISQDLRVATPKFLDDAHRASTTIAEPSQQRYALAIDTRYLFSSTSTGSGVESSRVPESLINNCKVLTKSLHSRGITPCIVAATTASNKTRSNRHYTHENKRVAAALSDLGLGIETHKLTDGKNAILRRAMDIDDDTLYSQVKIPSAKMNSGVYPIPLPLNATYSWLLLSAMGESQMRILTAV